jgi:hypothetical protein
MTGSFFATAILLMKLKSFWQASEQHNPHAGDAEADMHWLI